MIIPALAYIAFVGAAAQGGFFDLKTADIQLDPQKQVHTVEITAAFGYTTHVVFPDDFAAHNVSCGQCLIIEPGKTNPATKANWSLEIKSTERRIALRAMGQPTEESPASAFETNVVVGLDGGHTVNVVVRFVGDPEGRPVIHTVVTLTLPEGETFSGRLAEAKRAASDEALANVRDEANALMLARLFGKVTCRQAWGRPVRADRTVVRLGQMCSSTHQDTKNKTFFLMFQVQNRSRSALHIAGAKLEPQDGSTVTLLPQEPSYHLKESVLPFDQKTKGIVIASLDDISDTTPGRWKMTLTVGEREAVEVKDIVF